MSLPVLQERSPLDAAATTATGSGTAARGSLGTPHCHTPYDARIDAPQAGIFALGTASHAYLELELVDGREGRDLVGAAASLREPRTTMGGVNLVAGFRPELWRAVLPADAPVGLEGFNGDVVGSDGYVIPATQHDAVLWLSGSAYDVIFDTSRAAIAALAGLATVAEETSSWPYRHDLDLTGFIDGTENPTLAEAPDAVLVPDGMPGAGSGGVSQPRALSRRAAC